MASTRTFPIRYGLFRPLLSVLGAGPAFSSHEWRGEWLVNGGVKGVVAIDIDPPARARVLGVPVRLRRLLVNVHAPDELIAVLTDGGVHHHGEQD